MLYCILVLSSAGTPRCMTNHAWRCYRYLNIYEKVHYLGLDPDHSADDQEDGPTRKKVCLPVESIPLTYNYHHHKLQGRASQSGLRSSCNSLPRLLVQSGVAELSSRLLVRRCLRVVLDLAATLSPGCWCKVVLQSCPPGCWCAGVSEWS